MRGLGRKYSATRSARDSSSAEYCSFSIACGLPLRCSAILPDPWPITSCRSVVSSPATLLHFSALAASSGDHANSRLNSAEVDLSYASFTFASDTDLLPYFSRMPWSLGRLMPTGVIGEDSPP